MIRMIRSRPDRILHLCEVSPAAAVAVAGISADLVRALAAAPTVRATAAPLLGAVRSLSDQVRIGLKR